MNALLVLTVANIRSFLRDRAALFWTIAFPLIFIFLFGAIFSGGGDQNQTLGWVDEDGSPSATSVHDAFAAMESVELASGTRDEVLAKMRSGDLDAVLIAPRGFGAAVEAAAGNAGPPAGLEVYTDPSQARRPERSTRSSGRSSVSSTCRSPDAARRSCPGPRRSRPRT
jgi:ABC-2 type transport system permease protein